MRIGHVVLPSTDLRASAEFYERALGLHRIAHHKSANMMFLSFGTTHHDIALSLVDRTTSVGSLGKAHTAIRIEGGTKELDEFRDGMVSQGIAAQEPHDFGFMYGFYVSDPDGNVIEVFCDTMRDDDAIEYLRKKGTATVTS